MKKQKKRTVILIITVLLLYGIQIGYTKLSQQEESISILGFHHIASDKDKATYFKYNMWVTSISDFEAQIKWLFDEGYHSVSLDDLYAWKKGEKELDQKSVVLTFDDGFLSSTTIAAPILKKYHFQGSVFAIGSMIKDHGAYDGAKRQHASLADMKDESVMRYYSHSYDLHQREGRSFKINKQSVVQLEDDLKKSNTFVSSAYYAYPYGAYNNQIMEVLQANKTKLAFGYHENRKAKRSDHDLALPRFSVNGFTKLDVFQQMLKR